MKRRQFIVKVQIDVVRRQELLVYNKDRSVFYQCSADQAPEVVSALAGDFKAYFHARLTRDKQIMLDDRAPEQDW